MCPEAHENKKNDVASISSENIAVEEKNSRCHSVASEDSATGSQQEFQQENQQKNSTGKFVQTFFQDATGDYTNSWFW